MFENYAGRTVIVTGATGFIGSHLSEILTELNADVRVLIRASSKLENLKSCIGKIKTYEGDLQDITSLINMFNLVKKDCSDEPIIIHLAAQAHVKRSWNIPYNSIQTNAIGTLNLLEAIRQTELRIYKISVAGSSEEYGNHPGIENSGDALNEESPINPISPYGVAKVATDFLARNYWQAYGIPAVVVRMFNNFGPRQNLEFITPTVINQAIKQREIFLGNLKPKRDFLYVRDGANGHLSAALSGDPGNVYCCGYGETITMQEWTDKIIEIGTKKKYWDNIKIMVDPERFRPGNTELWWLKVDHTKLTKDTGWMPKYSWNDGLEATIDSYVKS